MTTPRDKIHDLKSFEKFLRVRGFSRKEALLIASVGFREMLKYKSQPAHNQGDDKSCS